MSVRQGERRSFEDVHFCDQTSGLVGVFDGHLGDEAAAFCAERLPLYLAKALGLCVSVRVGWVPPPHIGAPTFLQSLRGEVLIRIDSEDEFFATGSPRPPPLVREVCTSPPSAPRPRPPAHSQNLVHMFAASPRSSVF